MKIALTWNELPKYAAYPLAEIIKYNPKLEIISIKSKLPINNLEKILKKKIHWVDNEYLKWKNLGLEVPQIYFQAGWYLKSFSSLGKEVKQNGGKVILLSDNSFKNNLKQLIGSIFYRYNYLRYFDRVWVPGASGEKLMRFFGVPQEKIFQGLYCSNEKIFKKGVKINKRPKTFLFVGKLIQEKGFKELVSAFKIFLNKNEAWKLIIVGNGPLKKIIPKHKSIEYLSFKTPEEIANLMKKSRFLVLPSYSDHWPLVVNEATLCGCGLILSSVVGNIPELSNNKNSIIFKPRSSESLLRAIEKSIELSKNDLDNMYKNSIRLSSNYSINNWVVKFESIIRSVH